MSQGISRTTAPHYHWGEGCEGWRLLAEQDLSIVEERMPPGTQEVRHRHTRARQFFFVLAGSLELEIEEERHRLGPGMGVEVPPTAAHQVLNQGPAEARFLVISAPTSAGDRTPA